MLKGDPHHRLATSLRRTWGCSQWSAALPGPALLLVRGRKGIAGTGTEDVTESIARVSLKFALLCSVTTFSRFALTFFVVMFVKQARMSYGNY